MRSLPLLHLVARLPPAVRRQSASAPKWESVGPKWEKLTRACGGSPVACTAYTPLVRTSVPPASPNQPTDAHLRCAARRKQTQTRSGGFFEPAASRVASDRRCVYDYVSLFKRTRASFEQRRRPTAACLLLGALYCSACASKGALPWCARRLLATMGCSSKWRSRRASDRTSSCSKRMEYSHTPRLRTQSKQTPLRFA